MHLDIRALSPEALPNAGEGVPHAMPMAAWPGGTMKRVGPSAEEVRSSCRDCCIPPLLGSRGDKSLATPM